VHRGWIVTLWPFLTSNIRSIRWGVSTPDQLLYSALHGTAVLCAAEQRNLAESIAELREIADGRDHVLAEAAASPRVLGMPARPLMSDTS
jgi:hypothetical protein